MIVGIWLCGGRCKESHGRAVGLPQCLNVGGGEFFMGQRGLELPGASPSSQLQISEWLMNGSSSFSLQGPPSMGTQLRTLKQRAFSMDSEALQKPKLNWERTLTYENTHGDRSFKGLWFLSHQNFKSKGFKRSPRKGLIDSSISL